MKKNPINYIPILRLVHPKMYTFKSTVIHILVL